MPILLWDASALAKRYAAEVGTDTVNALFAALPLSAMVTTILAYAETYSVLVRKRNRGALDAPTFTASSSALKLEVILNTEFGVLSVEYDAVLDGVELVGTHSINAADAATLAIYLRYAQAALAVGEKCIF